MTSDRPGSDADGRRFSKKRRTAAARRSSLLRAVRSRFARVADDKRTARPSSDRPPEDRSS